MVVAKSVVMVAMMWLRWCGALRKKAAMKNRKKAWLYLAATFAMAVNGCGNSTVASSPSAAPPATPNPAATTTPAPPAKPTANEPSDILSVLSVEHQVDVATQRDGIVISIVKDEGATVAAGDVLGQLDDRTLQMEMIKARDDLHVSENNVKFKEAERKAKDAAYHRQQQLRELGLSSQADLEAAEFEAKGAEYDLHGYEALVESGQAQIHQIEIQIDQTRIRAPFSGAVVRRYIREGEAISKNDKCFRVSQLSPLQVQFQIPESSARRPKLGTSVEIWPVGDADRSLTARIVKISPTVDPASDSYDVVAQLIGTKLSDLRPGMAVRVSWPGANNGASDVPRKP
jgi:RND family efflux transporter MFP subunit